MEAEGRPPKKPTSPWVWVGCGCGAIVVLGMLAVAGVGWWGINKGKEVAETMADPEKRAAKVKEVLPYERLPEGYYPAFSLSVPFIMDMAVLSDHEPTAVETTTEGGTTDSGVEYSGDHDFDQRGFIYFNMRQFGKKTEEMRRFMRGEAPLPKDSPWQSNVEVNSGEVVRRGSITSGGKAVLFSASRGEISRQGRDKEGLVTMVMPECNDNRMRFGLWFSPDPDPQKPIKEVDWAGTGADPAALQQFLGYFKLCGAGG